MERCGVSNRVRHWEDSSAKARPSCFRPVMNTQSVFSRGDADAIPLRDNLRPESGPEDIKAIVGYQVKNLIILLLYVSF